MFEFKENINKEEYDFFVAHHPLNSLLQSYDWYNIKNNWEYVHTGVYNENKLVGVSLILIRRLAKKTVAFGYIPRGPILDYENKELVKFYIDSLKKFAKKNHLLFVKFDPKVVLRSAAAKVFQTTNTNEQALETVAYLKSLGLVHKGFNLDMGATIQPRFDILTYLEEDTQQKFEKKTLQIIRKAMKRNVSIVKKTTEDLDDFSAVLNKTINRKNISLRDKAYFKLLMDTYPNTCELLFAELDLPNTIQKITDEILLVNNKLTSYINAPKKTRILEAELQQLIAIKDELIQIHNNVKKDVIVLSGALSIGYGDTYEMLYAGFDEEYTKFAPQYLLYATAMERAYKKGYKKCNMGGVEGSLLDGLTIFKSHYNGTVEEYIGEFDLPTSILYKPFQILWDLRKKI